MDKNAEMLKMQAAQAREAERLRKLQERKDAEAAKAQLELDAADFVKWTEKKTGDFSAGAAAKDDPVLAPKVMDAWCST